MEVVGDVDGGGAPVEGGEAVGLDGDDALLVLDHPLDDQGVGADDDPAVGLEAPGGDDGVGEAGLVLDGQEDESLGGAGPLPDDDDAGYPRAPPVADAPQVAGARDPLAVQ